MDIGNNLLSYRQIMELVESGFIEGAKPSAVQASSLDLHLSDFFYREVDGWSDSDRTIDLADRESTLNRAEHRTYQYTLEPDEFILGATQEVFHLPRSVSGLFVMRSKLARLGLDQMSAAWAQAGWSNSSLTLELKNVTRFHRLTLTAGMSIGQMVFWRHEEVPQSASYFNTGRFNNHRGVHG